MRRLLPTCRERPDTHPRVWGPATNCRTPRPPPRGPRPPPRPAAPRPRPPRPGRARPRPAARVRPPRPPPRPPAWLGWRSAGALLCGLVVGRCWPVLSRCCSSPPGPPAASRRPAPRAAPPPPGRATASASGPLRRRRAAPPVPPSRRPVRRWCPAVLAPPSVALAVPGCLAGLLSPSRPGPVRSASGVLAAPRSAAPRPPGRRPAAAPPGPCPDGPLCWCEGCGGRGCCRAVLFPRVVAARHVARFCSELLQRAVVARCWVVLARGAGLGWWSCVLASCGAVACW